MPRAYSLDLRERLLRARDAGMTARAIEHHLGISQRTQRRWVQRAAQDALAPRPIPGRPRRIDQSLHEQLCQQVAAHPDATLADHAAVWASTTGTLVSVATMSRALIAAGISRKKRP